MADQLEVARGEPVSPHNEALYDAGKAILVETIEVGRDFCRYMIGIATGAIPTYLALVGFALGSHRRLGALSSALLLVAPAIFLLAGGIFAIGYLPVRTTFSLDLPEEIERARTQIIARRRRCAGIGFALFLIAVLVAIAGAAYALSISAKG
jgi:hypothetical protein